MVRLTAIALAAAVAWPALAAEECTDDKAEALSNELFKMIEDRPGLAEKMERHVVEIEKEYGGEPSEAETCEALRKLIARMKADD